MSLTAQECILAGELLFKFMRLNNRQNLLQHAVTGLYKHCDRMAQNAMCAKKCRYCDTAVMHKCAVCQA